ncbi:DUF58 domain-containing protein [Chloroflexota bacterium]
MSNKRNTIYVLLILSLGFGLVGGRPLLFTLAYVLGGLLIVSFLWAWLGISWIKIKRGTRARRAQVGNRFEEFFEVKNNSILPKLWLEVQDHSTLPGYQASYVVPNLLPQARHPWNTSIVCALRGEYQLGPITLASGDPFGLFRFPRHIGATSKITVYPAVVPIHQFALPSGLLSGGDAQRRRAHFVTTNAAGVREYAPGDSFNRIHWRSTARKNRLLVKEFELDPLADVWVFLDLSAATQVEKPGVRSYSLNIESSPTTPFLPDSTEEYSVVIAASISKFFLDKGRNLGLITYGPHREIIHADRSQRQMNQIMELLAVISASSDFDLEHMLSLNTEYLGRGTTLILITADQNDGWIEQAHTLARRGIRIVAIILDPATFGGKQDSSAVQARLATFHVPTYIVRAGDNLTAILSNPIQ